MSKHRQNELKRIPIAFFGTSRKFGGSQCCCWWCEGMFRFFTTSGSKRDLLTFTWLLLLLPLKKNLCCLVANTVTVPGTTLIIGQIERAAVHIVISDPPKKPHFRPSIRVTVLCNCNLKVFFSLSSAIEKYFLYIKYQHTKISAFMSLDAVVSMTPLHRKKHY